MNTTPHQRMCMAGALALGMAFSACGDDPVQPEPVDGAALRILFDENLVADNARIELLQDRETPPPTCPVNPTLVAAASEPVLCTRGTYVIQNLLGDTVKSVAEESWDGRAPSWNRIDDDGQRVPNGIYPVEWQCLDGGGTLKFSGHYYVWGPDQEDSCTWLLWSDTVDLSGGDRRFEFTRFPEALSILAVAPGALEGSIVDFANPYLLRVHVAGRQVFQQAVVLEEGSFTEVRVLLAPAS